jgi:hypothetical protein
MSLSRQLVARLRSLPSTTIPADIREAAKLHLLDAIGGGGAAGAHRPPSRDTVLAKFRASAALIGTGDVRALQVAVERQPIAAITQLLRTFQSRAVACYVPT